MNTVDRRAVELEFDNAKFEKNARSTIKALNDLDKALEMKGSTDGLEKLERASNHFSLRNIEDNVERIGSSFTLLGRTVFKVKDQIASSMVSMIFTAKRYANEYVSLLTTMSQANAGFSKYERKTSAVQAIKSALPDTDLSTITKALEDLNKYTDETSYDFTEMVNTIGKFTANGVKLEDAVEAMKGIGNEAAKSGASIQEANRAMYNFAQALSTGSVKLIDWKSIENANMATKEFKEQIIETALELGVLKKQGDKIRTKKGTLVDFTTFSTTLNEGWFTSEVLTKVLGKYADTTTKFGLDAFHAAQQAKTLTEAIDAVKDAASTGWMKTWELVFGNLEEAIDLFTGLANRLIEITDAVSEWRNGLLEGWRALHGREDLIKGLSDAFEGLMSIVNAVGDGIRSVFPDITAKNLADLTKGIRTFGSEFRGLFVQEKVVVKNSEKFVAGMETVFEDLSGVLRRGATGDEVKKLQERLKTLGYDLGDAGVDGIFGPKTEAALKKFQEEYGLAVDGIYGKLSHAMMGEKLPGPIEQVRKVVKTIEENTPLYDKLKRIVGGFAAIARIFGRVLGFVWNVAKKIGDTLKPIADVLVTIFAGIGDFFIGLDQNLEKGDIFISWLERIGTWLEPIGKWLSDAGNAFLKFFGFVKDEKDANDETSDFMKLIESIKQKLRDSGALERFANAVDRIREAFTKAREKLAEYFETFKTYLTEKYFTKTAEDGSTQVMTYADVLENAANFIADVIIRVIDAVTWVIENLPKGVNKIKQFLTDLFTGIDIPAALTNGWEKVVEFFTNVWSTIAGLFGLGQSDEAEKASRKGFQPKHGKKEIQNKFDFLEWLAKIWNDFINGAGRIFENIADFIDRHGVIGKIEGLLLTFQGLFIGKALLNLSNLAKGVVKIGQTFAKSKVQDSKAKKWEAIASTLKSLALVIGVMVAAVWVLGTMDYNAWKRGLTTLAGIVAFIGLFVALSATLPKEGSQKSLEQVANVLKGVAASIGVMVAAIWVLGSMSEEKIISGLFRLAFVLGEMVVFIKLIKGSSFDLKGLKELAIAVGILVASVWAMGVLMSDTQIYKGLGGVLKLLLMLAGFVIVINKFGGGTIKMKGLIALSAAIGILALVVLNLGLIPDTILHKGLGALTVIGVILSGVAAVFGTVGKDIKVGAVLVVAGALAALMWVMKECIKDIKDVDPEVMIAFGESLALGLGTMAAAIIASNKLGGGVKGMASGAAGLALGIDILVADLVLLVAAIGAIDTATDGGLTSALEQGGKTLAALGNALSLFSESIGDDSALATAALVLGAASVIAGLPGTDFTAGALKVAGAIGVILLVAEAFVGVNGAVNQITDGGWVDLLNSGAEVMSAFGRAIGAFAGGIRDGFDNTEKKIKDLELFGEAMDSYSGNISGIAELKEGLEADTQAAIDVAKIVHDYFNEMVTYPINFKAMAGYETAPAQISTDMKSFADAISALRIGINGLSTEEELMADITKAFTVTYVVKYFFDGIADEMPTDANLVRYNARLKSLFGNVDDFGTTVQELASKLNGISESDIIASTKIGIDAMTSIESFFTGIVDLDIDPTLTGWQRFFGETNSTNNFFGQVASLGESIRGIQGAFGGISTSGLLEDTILAQSVMENVAEFLGWLSTDDATKWLHDDDAFYTPAIERFSNDIDELGDSFKKFWEKAKNVDDSKLFMISYSVKTLAEALSLMSTVENDGVSIIVEAMDTVAGRLEDYQILGLAVATNFADGLTSGTDVVSNAALALKQAILDALALSAEDISNALVITPVVDMSSADASLRKFTGSRHISVGGLSRGAERTFGAAEQSRSNANLGNVTNNISDTATVTVTGNTFEIRKEDDINKLANKIAELTNQQQRGFGSSIGTRIGKKK